MEAFARKAETLQFKKITQADMDAIFPLLLQEGGRTTDFSYGGLLMWVDFFKYEYCILDNTLFIKGTLEDDRAITAFSLPVGRLPVSVGVKYILEYCRAEGISPVLSAVPEYALRDIAPMNPASVTELRDWSDYLYDAQSLATLAGKKMNKKRNHVNRFMATYPFHTHTPICAADREALLAFMAETDSEADMNENARAEREMTRKMIGYLCDGDSNLLGYKLIADGMIVAFTICDVKGDTLFVHIEKARREVPGAYEAINSLTVTEILKRFPHIKYVNREDDGGDLGLRMAKESYHPLDILRKFNVRF